MDTYTPGPWTAHPGDDDVREGWRIEGPSGQAVVGNCVGAGVIGNADMWLIVSAPELLEAAKLGASWIQAYAPDAVDLAKIKAVIAKAEGQAPLSDKR
jgi:hypothetical protein